MRWHDKQDSTPSHRQLHMDNSDDFKGNRIMVTSEQLEQLMFSKLNMIIKRNYYTPEQQKMMKEMLLIDIKQYLELNKPD